MKIKKKKTFFLESHPHSLFYLYLLENGLYEYQLMGGNVSYIASLIEKKSK